MNQFGGMVEGEYLTDKNNFRGLANAIIYLFRSSTGEDWNKIMHELTLQPDGKGNCIDDQDYFVYLNNEEVSKGCGSSFSYIYFFAFTIIVTWLIINLAVAAVIEGLESSTTINVGVFKSDDVNILLEAWQHYDPDATGWIKIIEFIEIIIELPPPFGNEDLKNNCFFEPEKFEEKKKRIFNPDSYYINEEKGIIIKNKEILKILTRYKIHTYKGRPEHVHFKDIFQQIVKRKFREDWEDFQISKHLKIKMKGDWDTRHSQIKKMGRTGFKAH